MDFTCIFFGVLFTIAGFLFACGKGYTHLSAWKNMPQEEKDKIKIIPLCRNICLLYTSLSPRKQKTPQSCHLQMTKAPYTNAADRN